MSVATKKIRLAQSVGGLQQLQIDAAPDGLDPVLALELGGYETLAPSNRVVDTQSRRRAEGR